MGFLWSLRHGGGGFSGVIGRSRIGGPITWLIALAIAGATRVSAISAAPFAPNSATPFAPSGLK